MKISIGINIYKPVEELSTRQQRCIIDLQSLDNVTLYNASTEDIKINGFNFLKLNRTSKDIVPNSTRELPMSKDIFNLLSETDCDYFIYLNDDIMLRPILVTQVAEGNFDSYIASRIDTTELTTSIGGVTPLSCNLHGFDLFAISKKWWLENKKYFPNFVLGRYYWDTYYYCLCHIFGNALTLNDKAWIFHPAHESVSNVNDAETIYNTSQLQECIIQLWHNNVLTNFKNRKSKDGIKDLIPTTDEREIEKQIFKTFYEKNFSNICG